MIVKIIPNTKGTPVGHLADAELHFDEHDGPLAGLKLIGFGVWERRGAGGRNVTYPARLYSINGERRTFALLRSREIGVQPTNLRDLILSVYADWTTVKPTVGSEGRA